MKLGDREAEIEVAAHYLVDRLRSVRGSRIQPEHFVADIRLKAAWEEAQRLQEISDDWLPADIPTLRGKILEELHDKGGRRPPEIQRAEDRMLRTWSVWVIRRAAESTVRAIDADDYGTLSEMTSSLRQAMGEAEAGSASSAESSLDVCRQVVTTFADAWSGKGPSTVPMPLRALHEAVGGWRHRLHLIGGIGSGHKTTLARMAWSHAGKVGARALYWTFEDENTDISARDIAAHVAGFDTKMLATGEGMSRVSGDGQAMMFAALDEYGRRDVLKRLFHIDTPVPTLGQVLGRIRGVAARGLDLVVLDYIQLIMPDTASKDGEYAHWRHVSAALAGLAKELKIAIVATAQITQDATRKAIGDDKAPGMGDLLGGAAVHQNAFGIIMLHRPKYKSGQPKQIQVRVAKWKSGGTGMTVHGLSPASDRIEDDGK